MGWSERLGLMYGAAKNTAINLTASALNTAGTIACAIGGGGFAASHLVDKSMQTSYLGMADVKGDVHLAAKLESTDLGFNVTLPITISGTNEGGETSGLPAYLSPATLQVLSTAFIISGVMLRSLGANLNKIQQHREDKRYHETVYQTELPGVPFRELLHVNAESICSSLSIAFFSNTLVGILVCYLDAQDTELFLTYPVEGTNYANGTDYGGPLKTAILPVTLNLGTSNITVTLPYLGNVTIELDTVVDALANITGGAGICFPENGQPKIPPVVASSVCGAAGVATYLAKNFFTNQIKHKRDNRLFDQRLEESYASINSSTIN